MRRDQRLIGSILGVVGFVAAAAGYPAVQDGANFTVSSIKPSPDNNPGMVIRQLPNGGYSAQKINLLALLTSAFGVAPQRIIGIPDWGKTDRYDIEARYESQVQAAPKLNLLLQGLLRERFALRAHMDKRDFPVYFLRTVAKDGKPGPGLKRSANECADVTAASTSRLSTQRAANGAPLCSAIERPDAFIAGGVTMDALARSLRIPSGRDVIDDTNLSGVWQFSLEFAVPGDTTGVKPDIFSAIKAQLQLKLEPGTGPLDVLVIESVARPTPN